MSKIIYIPIIVGVVALGVVLSLGGEPTFDGAPEYVTAPENNTYKIGQRNYESEYKPNITEDGSLKYKLDDKYISFTPTEMRWDNTKFKDAKSSSISVFGSQEFKTVEYLEVFDKGIDLYVNEGERNWSKIVTINSLEDLGEIPKNAEYFEIEYELDTNFIIDGWDKNSRLEITETTRLGDYSYIEPAYAWDSYTEEVCAYNEDMQDDVCVTVDHREQIRSYFSSQDNKLYYTKEIPTNWIKTAQYPIYTDADITYGTRQEFTGNDVSIGEAKSVCEIDTNKFVVVYCDNDDSYEAKAVVATVSGTTMTFGGTVSMSGNGVYGFEVACTKLDTDKFAAVYRDPSADGQVIVGTVVTRTITLGTGVEFDGGTVDGSSSIAQIDTDKFVIGWDDKSGTEVNAKVGTVITRTITLGTEVDFDTNNPQNVTVQGLGTDKFIICWLKSDNLTGTCEIGTVSTRTITADGTEYDFEDRMNNRWLNIAKLAEDKFVLCWHKSVSVDSMLRIGTNSGGAITYGNQATTTASSGYNDCVDIDGSRIVNTVETNASSNGESILSSYSGTTVTAGTAETWDSGAVFGVALDLISTLKIAVCFADDDSGDDGSCMIGDVASAAPPSDTCTPPASGDWYVSASDNCYITTDTYVNGYTYILNNTGPGTLNVIDGASLYTKGVYATGTFLWVESASGAGVYRFVDA